MPQQTLYFDYFDGILMPYIYVFKFKPCEINWDKPIFYFDAIAPLTHKELEEFDDSLINMTICFSDFIFNRDNPNRIGLNLRAIKRRVLLHEVDPDVINQLILPTSEINDLLAYLPNERKMYFFTN